MCDSGAPAVSYERPEQPLDLITEACTNVGLALGTDIHIALNCGAPGLMDFVSCSCLLYVSQCFESVYEFSCK